MPNSVKILAIGDVVGRAARSALIDFLATTKEKYKQDFTIVNVENATHGHGLSYKHYQAFKAAGVDVMTMGNHCFGNKEIYGYIDKTDNLLIPANLLDLDEEFKKHLSYTLDFKGHKIKVLNILGNYSFDKFNKEPFYKTFDKFYNEDPEPIYIVDFHSEITGEKNAFGYVVDGRASLLYGTHTHVQTADERILPLGTAYITDIGMCGSYDSVIGYDYEQYVKRIYNNEKSTVSTRKPILINGILVEIDLDTKKAISIQRIQEIIK